jgi:hypothetical protein
MTITYGLGNFVATLYAFSGGGYLLTVAITASK